MKLQAKRDKKFPDLYIQEYYNPRFYYSNVGIKSAAARIVNALIEALNERDRLPKFVIVFMDRDILMNIDWYDTEADPIEVMQEMVGWVSRQFDLFI